MRKTIPMAGWDEWARRTLVGVAVIFLHGFLLAGGCSVDGDSDEEHDFILQSEPADGEEDVGTDADVVITFRAPVDPNSVGGWIDPEVDFDEEWSEDNTVLTVLPAEALDPCTEYEVGIYEAVFAAGGELGDEEFFSFTTAGCPGDDGTQGPPDTDGQPDTDIQTGSGTASLSGVVQSAEMNPVPLGAVIVKLGDASTVTANDGTFLLEGVRAGQVGLSLDGTNATTNEGYYAQFQTELTFEENEQRVLERPVYLPLVRFDSLRQVSELQPTTIATPDGITAEIPAGAARMGGEVYTGPISFNTLPVERTPMSLPERFAARLDSVITIQPAGIQFPVPVPITFPDSDPTNPNPLRSLWSLDHDTGTFFNAGLGEVGGGTVVTTSGGIRGSSWHFFTDLEVQLLLAGGFDPSCLQGGVAFANGCLRSYFGILGKIVNIAAGTVPGAGPVFSRFGQMLEGQGISGQTELERAANTVRGRVTDAVLNEIPTPDLAGLGSVSAKQIAGYVGAIASPPLFSDFQGFARDVQTAAANCDILAQCRGFTAGTLQRRQVTSIAELTLDQMAREIETILDNRDPFDRLAAAFDALEPYFLELIELTDATLPGWQAAVQDWLSAYNTFAPYDNTGAAYDRLVELLSESERRIRQILDDLSDLPAIVEDSAAAAGLRICPTVEASRRSVVLADGSVAMKLGPFPLSGVPADPCYFAAVDPARGVCSAPILETEASTTLSAPAVLTMDRTLRVDQLIPGSSVGATITDDEPIHYWRLDGSSGQAFDASINGAEQLLVAVGRPGETPTSIIDGRSFFLQFDTDETREVQVYGLAVEEGTRIDYSIALDAVDQTDVIFGQRITGTFDTANQTFEVTFSGQIGQRILVEKRCCEVTFQFTYDLRDATGNVVQRLEGTNQAAGRGNDLFVLPSSGSYRFLLSAFPGETVDYEVVLHLVKTNAPQPISLGTNVVVNIGEIGETFQYTFEASTAQALTITGVAETALGAVLVRVSDPSGIELLPEQFLYADGSESSVAQLTASDTGTHTLTVRTWLQEPFRGSFTIRIE